MVKGRLTIFTSYTPGAGKSYRMLRMARKRQAKGMNVIYAFVNSSHRALDMDIGECKQYSLSEIIKKDPDLVVLDEMGMRGKNTDEDSFIYEDIDKLLDAGINVYTSINLKRFAGANPKFRKISGIRIKSTVPDEYLEKAYRIYYIDRDPKYLIEDFEEQALFKGKYRRSFIMQKNFKPEILKAYRKAGLDYIKQYGDKVTIKKRDE